MAAPLVPSPDPEVAALRAANQGLRLRVAELEAQNARNLSGYEKELSSRSITEGVLRAKLADLSAADSKAADARLHALREKANGEGAKSPG